MYIHTHTGVPETFDSFKERKLRRQSCFKFAISLCTSSTELTYPKLSACLPSSNGSRLKILAMLFLFVPQESWDLQLRMFGYITCGFPRIFGYVLQVIKYFNSVPLDRGGFGGWNLMPQMLMTVCEGWSRALHLICQQHATKNEALKSTFMRVAKQKTKPQVGFPTFPLTKGWWLTCQL